MLERGNNYFHKVLVAESGEEEICGCVEVGMLKVEHAGIDGGPRDGREGKESAEVGMEKAYVGNLAVKQKWRRRGVGRRLAEECHRVALEWGHDEVYLHVDECNEMAVRFYKGLGYRCQRREPDWYEAVGRTKRLLLKKKLKEGETEERNRGLTLAEWKEAPIVDSRKLNFFEYLLYCIYDLKEKGT